MAKEMATRSLMLLIIAMLITGSLNVLNMKLQLQITSVGVDGTKRPFEKPWFIALIMMMGMWFTGICDYLVQRCRASQSARTAPLVAESSSSDGAPTASFAKRVSGISVPATLDTLATLLCATGLIYIPASVWQMLRGACIVFTAMLAVLFLKQKLVSHHYIGLLLCVLGVTLVGYANVLADTSGDESLSPTAIFGVVIVLAGQAVQAAQIIAEEFLVKNAKLAPLQVVGWEGFWGTLLMILVIYPAMWVIPGSDHGHVEDPVDTLVMLKNSGALIVVVCCLLLTCGLFNATGIFVMAKLSGVVRMMLDASRTLIVWGVGLFIHYCVDAESKFGEVWTTYSFVQLAGFICMVVGQAAYGEVIKLPCLTYPVEASSACGL